MTDELITQVARIFERARDERLTLLPPRGSLRSGSTVNRYVYLLSAIFSQTIEEEIVSQKPCVRINDEPENKDANGINEYWIDKGFEDACNSARFTFGAVKPGGIIWHDIRWTFATRLRAHGVHEYDIQDLLGHSKPGVTKVYARATLSVLEAAVEKITKPVGQIVEFGRRAG